MRNHHLLAVLVLCIFSGISSAQTQKVVPVAKELPTFPFTEGWTGADDAYSIQITPTKSVWLFGDTFVTDPGVTDRGKAKNMARNTLGVTDCQPDKSCTIQYYWKDPQSAKPRSFFDTGKEEEWYWPLDGYFDGKKLYISLMIVQTKKGSGPEDPFGFQIAGTEWAVVHNPLDSPDKWKFDLKKLTDGDLWVGDSIFEDGKYATFYSQVSAGEGKGYMTVLRVKKKKLDDPAKAWEYLGKDDKWHKGMPKGDAKVVIDQAISEMSVRYHPTAKKWVAISGAPEFMSNKMVARTSDSPIGPWSAPTTIFEYPEMDPKNPIYDKDTFCYATKEHVEFGTTQMVVTYACNSAKVQKVIENNKLYFPKVVVLDIPK